MRVGEESQSYIEAVEAEVDAIFRSRETFELPGADAPTLPVQAFVCGIRREEDYQVFVALYSKSCKRNLVYSIAAEKKGKSGYEAAMKGALDACQTMGFAMESVNLKFSTAMREVVIRDIPVLLSPAAARKIGAQKAEELAELERLATQQEENEAPGEAAAGFSPARRSVRERARQERQEEVKAAARKLAAESVVEESVTATRQAVERLLPPGFEVARREGAIVPAAKVLERTGEPQLPSAAGGELPVPMSVAIRPKVEQGDGDSQEVQLLAQKLERLEAAKSAAEQRVAELTETALLVAARAETERAERERLEAAKALAAERAAEMAEAARQAAERAETERVERERLETAKAAAEQRAAELAETARQAAERAETERAARERLEAAKTLAEERAAELAAAARQAAERAETQRAEREQLLAAKAAAEQRMAELAEAMRDVEMHAIAFRQEQEQQAAAQAKREQAERQRLAAEKAAAEQRSAELGEAVKEARSRIEIELAKREQLLAEKALVEKRAAELAEAALQAEQRVETERTEQEQLLAAKSAAEQRTVELSEAVRTVELQAVDFKREMELQTATQAQRMEAELKRLGAEKEAAERRTTDLGDAVKEVERRIEIVGAGQERLMAEDAAAEQREAEMAEAVRRAERQVAAAERVERERLEAAKSAAEQRAAELAETARQAAERAETERTGELAELARQTAERERLELEKARIERRLLERAEVPPRGKRGAVERGRQPTALPSLGGRFNSDSSSMEQPVAPPPKPSSRPSTSGAFFQVDWDFADVAYESVDDVLEVHQSISRTQLSLEGFPNQYCTAYIVALKKGKGRQVYVAFRLASSNRVLVYVPTTPPHNQDAYARTMQEANKFLRVTGIETERLPLGKSSQSRTQALSQIPILRLHPRNARNS
jgi:hypothetical protein